MLKNGLKYRDFNIFVKVIHTLGFISIPFSSRFQNFLPQNVLYLLHFELQNAPWISVGVFLGLKADSPHFKKHPGRSLERDNKAYLVIQDTTYCQSSLNKV